MPPQARAQEPCSILLTSKVSESIWTWASPANGALVCAASKGLGKGCAAALVHEGVNVVVTARGADLLQATAAALRALNPAVQVRAVVGDITSAAGRADALAACPQVDILINNAGGPPPGDFRDWDRDAWIKAVDGNMITPIELIKATVDAMAARADTH